MVSYRNVRYHLILSELAVGITCCRAAATSKKPSRRALNLRRAESACRTAADWVRETKLTTSMKQNVQAKRAYLEQLLLTQRNFRVIFSLRPLTAKPALAREQATSPKIA